MELTARQIDAMEQSLANDEESTDEELEQHFVAHFGATREFAQFAMTHRNDFLKADPNAAEQPSLLAYWAAVSADVAAEGRAERRLSPGYGS